MTGQQTDSSAAIFPRNYHVRLFRKNNTTVETEFPKGAIILFDSASIPTGWQAVNQDGYYIKVTDTSVGSREGSSHRHAFNVTSNTTTTPTTDCGSLDSVLPTHALSNHTHNAIGVTETADLNGWELNHVKFQFIKKVGPGNVIEDHNSYAYALFYDASTPVSGWADVTSSYEGRYLKSGLGSPSVGAAANLQHTHTIINGIKKKKTPETNFFELIN